MFGSAEYRVSITGTWTAWLTATTQTVADFIGEAGQSYYFRVQATDNVNNTGDWVEVGPVVVTLVRKNYYFGGQLVATRLGHEVYYTQGDHPSAALRTGLGSTSLTTDSSGAVVAEVRYLPYGEERWADGAAVSDITFTGQRAERGFGLMDYKARYYSPQLGRFVSADTVVPGAGNPQALNRYAYVVNNPLADADPSGHCPPSVPACRRPDGTPIDQYYRYGARGEFNAITDVDPWYASQQMPEQPRVQESHDFEATEIPRREPALGFSLEGGLLGFSNPHVVLRDDIAKTNATVMLGFDITSNIISSIGTTFVVADTVLAPADPAGKAFGILAWFRILGS